MDLAHFRLEIRKVEISKQTPPCLNPLGIWQDPIGGPFRV